MTDAYQESLEYLFNRLNYEQIGMPRALTDLRLARTRHLLRALGDPQNAAPIVHVAGTKGKGSTAAMIAAATEAAGLRTGLYCSPHLHRLEERFRVGQTDATPAELVALTEAVRPIVAELDATVPGLGDQGLTFFEITTAMGLLHFAQRAVDLIVLEVGMGGRLDSTNAVRPVVSVITSISFDHTRQLGRTLSAIAAEKAGIIKRGQPVVSGVEEPGPREVISRLAEQRHSPLRQIGRDFGFAYHPPVPPIHRPEPGEVAVQTGNTDWGMLRLPLLGPHQAHNAAVALAALEVLREKGFAIGPGQVREGFANLHFPARVEVLGRHPWLIVDGAHNVASAAALAETIRLCLPAGPRTLIFGTTRDKDLVGQLQPLLPCFTTCVATRYSSNPRSVPEETVAEAARSVPGRHEVLVEPELATALAVARRVTPEHGTICITGSLFLAAEARALVLGLNNGS